MRPIDADALKEKLKPCEGDAGVCENSCEGCQFRVVTAEEIDNAPTVPQLTVFAENASDSGLYGEWVPISKRLPEEDGIYLVTLEYVEDSEIVYETDMAKFVYSEKDDCNNGFHKAYTVIAWRPSPEPYEKGGAE